MPEFDYHGPSVLIVALQREVHDGDRVNGPAELEHSFGFTKVEKPAKAEKKGDD